MKLYMFRTVPLSIIRNYSLYTQKWYMSYSSVDSLRAGSGWDGSSILLLLASCQQTCTWFVPKVSVLIFLCTNWQRSTSLMYIGTLVVTLAACPYLFQLDWLSQSCATAVCVWSCFLTSLRLRCRKILNNGTLSNFV